MPLELVVVTPQGEAFSGSVEQVVLPGVEGEFGVLESHERFLSALGHGCMEIRSADTSSFSAISDGFAEVTGERVVVMVDSLVDAEDIDVEEARSSQQAASTELDQLGASEEQDARRAELQDSLARVSAQLAVASRQASR
jgi:F-type H+-transporting ATPase subunit epsilon